MEDQTQGESKRLSGSIKMRIGEGSTLGQREISARDHRKNVPLLIGTSIQNETVHVDYLYCWQEQDSCWWKDRYVAGFLSGQLTTK